VDRRLIVVAGQTATGKTEAAAEVARALGGEVIGADAYQVYRGMDVGTAKPAPEVRALVRHHLVDVLDPSQEMTLALYLDMARAALEDVWARWKTPVVCGGTGQYVWALVEGWQVPRVPPDQGLRAELEAFAAEHGPEALHQRLSEADPGAAARLDYRNVRRVVRALEVIEREGRPLSACRTRSPLDARVLFLCLSCERGELHRRIDARVTSMYAAGLVEEVRELRRQGFGESRPVRSAIGYKEAGLYLDGAISLEEAVQRTQTATHRLARNQATWFKAGDPRLTWVDCGAEAPARCVEIASAWLSGAAAAAG
jgi:tRNA dimethylallyltransferase